MKNSVIAVLIFIMTGNSDAQSGRSAEDAEGLPVGVKAPHFNAEDADGDLFSLEEAIVRGPVVLIFYRGHWCPYCNLHLGQLQDSLGLISERGASVVAVSPQKPEHQKRTEEKTGASFSLLYDEEYRIADAYNVTFTPGNYRLMVYNMFLKANLKEAQSDDSQRLPIPATYIIGKNGRILWRQFDPDYKERSSVAGIVRALDENYPDK